MENARLDDFSTEAWVFATNFTETMLNGKVYYFAIRGHTDIRSSVLD